jgi:4-alpha-glucanotransferase
MVPLPDYLLLSNEEGRINEPATAVGNWSWRVSPRYNTPKLRQKVLDIATRTNRNS